MASSVHSIRLEHEVNFMIRPNTFCLYSFVYVLALTLIIADCYAASTDSPVRNDGMAAEGKISFFFPDGKPQCSFSAVSAKNHFVEVPSVNSGDCKSLVDGGSLEMTNFPSATKIWLIKGRPNPGQQEFRPKKCGANTAEAYGWWELRTIKEPTNTLAKFDTRDLNTMSPGDVIQPGLRFIGKHFDTTSKPFEISCVIIEVSPLVQRFHADVPVANGKITLVGADGLNHCTLPFVSGSWSFKSNKTCSNDKAIELELTHAPSASNILLFDDYTCDVHDAGNYFWLSLRTIKEDFSTEMPIDLDFIASRAPGTVVAPGLLLVGSYLKPNTSAKKRTSCIKIEVDAAKR